MYMRMEELTCSRRYLFPPPVLIQDIVAHWYTLVLPDQQLDAVVGV